MEYHAVEEGVGRAWVPIRAAKWLNISVARKGTVCIAAGLPFAPASWLRSVPARLFPDFAVATEHFK